MNLPLNIDLQQILLHLLNAVILFAALYFILYKPVKKFMDERAAAYKEADEAAGKKEAQAEALKAEYEKKLADFSHVIEEEKAEEEREIASLKEQMEEEAARDAERILDDARIQAEQERGRILASVNDDIEKIVEEAERRVLPDNPSDAMDAFLNAAGKIEKDE